MSKDEALSLLDELKELEYVKFEQYGQKQYVSLNPKSEEMKKHRDSSDKWPM